MPFAINHLLHARYNGGHFTRAKALKALAIVACAYAVIAIGQYISCAHTAPAPYSTCYYLPLIPFVSWPVGTRMRDISSAHNVVLDPMWFAVNVSLSVQITGYAVMLQDIRADTYTDAECAAMLSVAYFIGKLKHPPRVDEEIAFDAIGHLRARSSCPNSYHLVTRASSNVRVTYSRENIDGYMRSQTARVALQQLEHQAARVSPLCGKYMREFAKPAEQFRLEASPE